MSRVKPQGMRHPLSCRADRTGSVSCALACAILPACFLLSSCSSTPGTPVQKNEPPAPPVLKLTQAEFEERFSRLSLPAPASRIEYLYGAPHGKETVGEKNSPALFTYRCRDGQMWISFGDTDGTFGALACHRGTATDAERTAVRETAERGVRAAQQKTLRLSVEQKERRLAYVQERLAENRGRILSLREQQAGYAETQWTLLQENLNRHRETELQRLLKACPRATPADKVDQELKHRNIRLQTLFRDEVQAFNNGLNERQRDADDKIRVMRQSMERSIRELAQLQTELKELREQLGETAPDTKTPDLAGQPDESPMLERWQAVLQKAPGIQAPVLTEKDLP